MLKYQQKKEDAKKSKSKRHGTPTCQCGLEIDQGELKPLIESRVDTEDASKALLVHS